MRIDVHSHLPLPELNGKAGKYGPNLTIDDSGRIELRIGDVVSVTTSNALQEAIAADPTHAKDHAEAWRRQLSDPHVRLAEMDEKLIDKMGVTIPPLFYLYWAEPEIGISFSRAQNEALAAYCANAPDRFFFMATLPMQEPVAAAAEVDYAVRELGARGVNIGGTLLAGRELDDPAFTPFFEKVVEHGIPLFIHPYPVTLAATARHPLGLDSVVDYISQETIAFATLLYGGVMDQFPELKVYITHGGGFVPYQFGRLEAFTGPKKSKAKLPLAEYLSRFYFDILVHDVRARRFLVEFMGADNLVVGSNYAGMDSADGFSMLAELKLPRQDEEKIEGANAAKLFGLA